MAAYSVEKRAEPWVATMDQHWVANSVAQMAAKKAALKVEHSADLKAGRMVANWVVPMVDSLAAAKAER